MTDLEKLAAIVVGLVFIFQRVLLGRAIKKNEKLQDEVYKEQLGSLDEKLKAAKEKTKQDEAKLDDE